MPEVFLVSPYFVFFLVHSVQIGVGILGFQQSLVSVAGNDSWIAVIIAGIPVHVVIWIIFQLMNRAEMDLIDINKFVFGKWLGSFFSLIWMFYFLSVGFTVLYSYFEVIHVWMFPEVNTVLLSILFGILIVYTVLGGFRTVAGVCFLGVLIPAYLIFTFLFPIPYTEILSLFPIWNHGIKDMFLASQQMILSYLGFSTLLMYYPFIKEAKTSHKWAQMGALITLLTYLLITIISLSYFSEEQLVKQNWATLTLWKIVEMPVVERFEYIGIASWALIILPNVCLLFWASTRGLKKILGVNQKYTLFGFVLLMIILSTFFQKREQVALLGSWTTKVGLYSEFGFVPLLFLLYLVVSKVRGKKN
jgi:spore germination protein (amino acid permease)